METQQGAGDSAVELLQTMQQTMTEMQRQIADMNDRLRALEAPRAATRAEDAAEPEPAGEPQRAAATGIEWVTAEEALASPLPVMVLFTLPEDQCPLCVVLKKQALSHPAVIAASASRACVEISGRSHPWARRLRVAENGGWPTLVFWSAAGIDGRLVGSQTSVDEIVTLLKGE